MVVRLAAVPSLVRVTEAPETTAPDSSVMVPRIEPESTCACRGNAASSKAMRMTSGERLRTQLKVVRAFMPNPPQRRGKQQRPAQTRRAKPALRVPRRTRGKVKKTKKPKNAGRKAEKGGGESERPNTTREESPSNLT